MKGGIHVNTASFGRYVNSWMIKVTKAVSDQIEEDLTAVALESQEEIPVDTGSAKDSIYLEKTYGRWELGYGEKFAKVNPKTGQSTNEYLTQLHEDLYVQHPNGGKAKFLEDPFRRYLARVGQGSLARNLRNRRIK